MTCARSSALFRGSVGNCYAPLSHGGNSLCCAAFCVLGLSRCMVSLDPMDRRLSPAVPDWIPRLRSFSVLSTKAPTVGRMNGGSLSRTVQSRLTRAARATLPHLPRLEVSDDRRDVDQEPKLVARRRAACLTLALIWHMRKRALIVVGSLMLILVACVVAWTTTRSAGSLKIRVAFTGYTNDASGARLAVFQVTNGSEVRIR